MLLRRHKRHEMSKPVEVEEKAVETAETAKPKSKKKAESDKKGE